MPQFSRRAIVIGAMLAVAACSAGELEGVLEPETGEGTVYTLASVNGKGLPAVVVQGSTSLEVQKGALTLAADSSWILSYRVRATGGGSSQTTVNTLRGVYSRSATDLTLRNRELTRTQFTGTWSTTQVALVDASVADGDRLVFGRQ